MKYNKVIITGINGFVGHHLTNELFNLGVSVIGVGQDENINDSIKDMVFKYYQANLINEWPETEAVDAVIHLAGLAAVGPSFDKPQLYINANTAMLTNLCEYHLKQDYKPRIVIVSSGSVYNSKQPMPIIEAGEISFSSPYVISKICNENQAEYYRNRGLDCIVVRPLNHIGPGQLNGFLVPDLYDQIKSLKENEKTISTGNINTKRDYTDVRDIAHAYVGIAMADKLNYNTYNICSGRSLSGVEIFNELKKVMKLDYLNYEIDPTKIRPTDALDIYGDSTRLKEDIGWQPEIAITQTLEDFVKSKN